ncbi:MAG: alpha/beta hydrolase [Patescibacteria group bacterium]
MDKAIIIDQIKVFYQENGTGEKYMLLLHGWGQSHAFWEDVINRFEKEYHIYTLDLPGFGQSYEPPKMWKIEDYANFVHAFAIKLNIQNPIIIGHSFGGRIAAFYASKYPVDKLILYSNGGLPPQSLQKKLSRHVFRQLSRIGKHLFPNQLYKLHTVLFRPKQYRNELQITKQKSQRMLDIYIQGPQDLTDQIKKITTDTLIISGRKDHLGEPSMGKRLHRLIKNSQLLEIPEATHFAHLERPNEFYEAVEKFLKR